MLILVLAAIDPNDWPARTVQNIGPSGSGARRGHVQTQLQPLTRGDAHGVDVGVECLELSHGEACLPCDLGERVAPTHGPVDRQTAGLGL